ncbi:hypothetical protein RB195_015139 [Necator americanus]|uniref:Secreted protein n=1 Tax=Necator americanus TaxID=51031 RepID=A0ABR1E3D0_NECAM
MPCTNLSALEEWKHFAVTMRLHHLLFLMCSIMFCSTVEAHFGFRCGYVGGWCGSEGWRDRVLSNAFRSKALLMGTLTRSDGENLTK